LLGVGGYASVPAVLAARTLGLPVVLQEQNRRPGMANRLLAPLARTVCVVDEEAARFFPARRTRATGNPVPGERAVAGRAEELGLEAGRFTLLVVGGSLGAVALNRLMAEAAPHLAPWAARLQVVHACGDHPVEPLVRAYAEAGIPARVLPFIDRMGAAYAAADAVVARAGALTCQELANAGLPALLIPYPYAAGDHQWHNALRLREVGAAEVVRQAEVDGARVAETVRRWLEESGRLRRQGEAARRLARPEAARRVAEALLAAAGGGSKGRSPQPPEPV
ncbi:MAG: UDP-N-acetylglucosamine--N-acetylmuramyl-(pentapeptide) pyrophosphoryl-undecaprenol N-acetylglucosamine transferase, partial [Nitrospirae bacterium]